MKKKKRNKICSNCGMKWPPTKRKCDNCGEKLEANLTLGQMKAELQPIFNKYVRLRDKGHDRFLCISCQKFKKLSEMQAGHYYPVSGYDGLRFDEDNVNGECIGCNAFDASHLINYGLNLERKIGSTRLAMLHERARAYKENGKKWRKKELQEKLLYYKQRVEEMNDNT